MKMLLGLLALAVGNLVAADLSFGITIGPPPPPRTVVVPASPGPGYVWVGGYWYPDGHRYRWHNGYWTRPPYTGGQWVAPHHDGQRYYNGYWDGERGRYEHDHRWDHDRNRDYRENH
jgi:hypothetical protein